MIALAALTLSTYFVPATLRWNGEFEKYAVEINGKRVHTTTRKEFTFLAPRGRQIQFQVVGLQKAVGGWENGYIQFASEPWTVTLQ